MGPKTMARAAIAVTLMLALVVGSAYGDDAYPAAGSAGVGAVTSPMQAIKEKALALSDTIVKCTMVWRQGRCSGCAVTLMFC